MSLKAKVGSAVAASIVALALGGAAAASTSGEVSVEIVAGTLTYSIEDAALDPVPYSEEDRLTSGMLQVSVNGHGTLGGWQLTVEVTEDFAYSGPAGDATAIPADNLRLTTAYAPTHSAGQVIDTTHGPVATSSSGSLGGGLPVAVSESGYGSGAYVQDLGVSLAIPAYAPVGTYTGVVTVTASAAPGGK